LRGCEFFFFLLPEDKKTVAISPAMACSVFVSVRVNEEAGEDAANKLKDALEAAGISCFVCGGALPGDELAAQIARALAACELFVVLGTIGFGQEGETRFSTREELQFAVEHNKPIFLIKRCDEFADPLTRLYLPASMAHQVWDPCTDMPEDLVGKIKAKLEAAADIAPSDAEQMCVSHSFLSALLELTWVFTSTLPGCRAFRPARLLEAPAPS
jgi:hypothetical protein